MKFPGNRSSGITVGLSRLCGESNLNLATKPLERASARTLTAPGRCLALTFMLFVKHAVTNFLMPFMMRGSAEDCLLIIATSASLSVRRRME